MSKTWRQEYLRLQEFITAHPEIVINGDGVFTPEESKEGFYSLFNAVLNAVTLETLPMITEESVELTKAYVAVETEAAASFNIDKTRALAEFYRFLDDPVGTIANGAFNPLFSLLQGKVSGDNFEKISRQEIEFKAHSLRGTVYEKWIILSLLKLMATQDIYDCSPLRPLNFRLEKFIRLDAQLLANTPFPAKTQQLSWEFDPQPIITQPDCILQARAFGKNQYVAIRTNFKMGTHRAKDFPEEGEWVHVRDSFKLESDFILLYCSDNLADLALLAERGRVRRPELVVRCLEASSKYSTEWLNDARTADAILQPNSGLYIVSKSPVAPLQQIELGEYMHFLEVGFDKTKLTPVIDALLKTTGEPDATKADSSGVK